MKMAQYIFIHHTNFVGFETRRNRT